MGLSDGIRNPDTRASVVADCVQLMDEQVAAKGGLGGLALKATYGAVKGIEPGYIPGAIQRLLPEAIAAIEPIWDEGLQAGNPVQYLSDNRSRAADMLLSTTDARIEKAKNGVVRASYNKLRKSVKTDIEEAVPGLAKILDTHLQG